MPLRGSRHSSLVLDDAPYFTTLSELDDWLDKGSSRLNGITKFTTRGQSRGNLSRGKLLVCHDYKGGYTEKPDGLAYTFNFWSYCDTFIYFAHHRVTIPPSGWTTAAHRQGVKMLGTLIFEGSGESDCLQLLVGRPPHGKTGPIQIPANAAVPVSPYYARSLARLAHQRGFDGYLLNFECPLQGGVEQARALTAWIRLFEQELKSQVGEHAEVIWYDSVVINGQLAWQDRLNSYNLPFFIPSSGFFTNYTWRPDYPALTAQYFLSLDPKHTATPAKTLRDIFVGVDVWGRGSHGGGGFGCFKAISHIDPESLGLSVALFGQAWTWESEQDQPGWSWDEWWAYERKLWVGPENDGDIIKIPEPPEGQPNCPHSQYQPLASYFGNAPPPNPSILPFYTTFSPGTGRAWFVKGVKVLQTDKGWTDVDKSSSIGNLIWPRPDVQWEHDDRDEVPPKVSPTLCLDDAWMGGNALRLSILAAGSDAEDAFFRCVWIPIQSLSITPKRLYDMEVILKTEHGDDVDLDVGLSVKSLTDGFNGPIEITALESTQELTLGWTKLAIQFSVPSDYPSDILSSVGLVVGFAVGDPTAPINFSVLIGSVSVYPSRISPQTTIPNAQILWADFQPSPSDSSQSTKKLEGVLTWDVAVTLPTLPAISISTPDDPTPLWTINQQEALGILYFNIWVQSRGSLSASAAPDPGSATFIGTTGLDGRSNRFYVDPQCLPEGASDTGVMRFLVQGVDAHGEVMNWERCAFVDVKVS